MIERARRGPLVAGLTGGIAAGKSTVSAMLAERGAHVIDADSVGHRVIAPGGTAYGDVLAAFGPAVVAEDGTVNRRELGAIVFADEARRQTLNAITHPRMAELMAAEIAEVRERHPPPPLIVLDAAILFEAGWDMLCDEAWVVIADPETAIGRLMARNGLEREAAQARLRAQMSNKARAAKADRVIQNDGGLDALRTEVERLWAELSAQAQPATEQRGP